MVVGDDNGAFIKRLKGNMDYEFRTLKEKEFSTIDARKNSISYRE